MKPDQFKKLRGELGWSARLAAQNLGVSDGRTVRRWEHGDRPIPPEIANRLLLAAHGVEPWLIASDPDCESYYLIRTRWPEIVFRVTTDGETDSLDTITDLSHLEPDRVGDYIAEATAAWQLYLMSDG